MQHLSLSKLNDFVDYSSLDDSINLDEFLSNKNANPITLPKLFAILRTWKNVVQKNYTKLVCLTLENDLNIDDYDVVTGMTLLHFTCKYGAKQFGKENEAVQVMKLLIEKGINLTAQCLWIQMNCLHYCGFFDSPSVCELLLKQSKVLPLLNQPCVSFKNGTPLHLACSALSLSTVQHLLQAGANKEILNDDKQTPSDCVPNIQNKEQQDTINKLLSLLRGQDYEQSQPSVFIDSVIDNLEDNSNPSSQFQIGERVRLTNNKTGIIKYFGNVPFGVNLWYGVALDEPTGKHDGCIGGVRYFDCPPNRGIFVQPSSVQKLTPVPQSPERERRFRPINFPTVNTNSITSRVDTGLKRDTSADGRPNEQLNIDDRVLLSKNRYGTIKYVGPTALGPGTWYGVELDLPDGLHDGLLSVDGQRYFHCKPQHGVFVRSQNLKKINTNDRLAQSLYHSSDHQTKRNSRMVTSEYDTTNIEDGPFSNAMESSLHSVTFHIGDKVSYNNHLAIVRYIGHTAFAEGIWVGIEFLSRAIGKNDGSVNGHVYFQCKPNHGLFIRPNRIALSKK